MKAAIALLLACTVLTGRAFAEGPVDAITHHDVSPSLDDYKPKVEMWFKTTGYSTFWCTQPHTSVLVNMAAAGIPNYGPPIDDQVLQKEIEVGNCNRIPQSVRFKVTPSIAVYVGNFGAVWAAGVKDPDGRLIGYVPTNSIEFIPVPTW
jgi:hypothetical protein